MLDRHRTSMRNLALFLGIFIALQAGWEQCRGSALERLIIDQATVAPAIWLLQWLWPELHVYADGHSLVAAHARLNVLNGCEGLEMQFLLAAAFLAFPLRWSLRAIGLGVGAVLIYILNEGRIVLLWHAVTRHPEWFGALHGIVLPLVLIAVVTLFFFAFLSLPDRQRP